MTAQQIIEKLGLVPLPGEGGYYRETHRSKTLLPRAALPAGYPAGRAASTAIYYLLTPETSSALHRLRGDEVWHFYLGDPVEQLQLLPDGRSRIVVLGSDLGRGQQPQALVPGGTWQSARLLPDGRFALLGTTMAPGFEFEEYEPGNPAELAKAHPLLDRWLKKL
ncbi:MAG TPA: cupin domain-containing protein [Kiritimatiellia bacterium]|nr:cupin domain-containing protein [Kiritimatiellia bacterium]HRZ11960.1 cupin domain-containing protein [Kiritimatiellia bacterium]HSA17234.1 cupin domain-containing protein [Kiritimatiellia bacterium]